MPPLQPHPSASILLQEDGLIPSPYLRDLGAAIAVGRATVAITLSPLETMHCSRNGAHPIASPQPRASFHLFPMLLWPLQTAASGGVGGEACKTRPCVLDGLEGAAGFHATNVPLQHHRAHDVVMGMG